MGPTLLLPLERYIAFSSLSLVPFRHVYRANSQTILLFHFRTLLFGPLERNMAFLFYHLSYLLSIILSIAFFSLFYHSITFLDIKQSNTYCFSFFPPSQQAWPVRRLRIALVAVLRCIGTSITPSRVLVRGGGLCGDEEARRKHIIGLGC